MGRVPTVESKEKVSSVKWNQLVADYLSQTDTGTQAIGGIVYIGRRASDPDTAGWGEAQKGYLWFNLTEGKYKYWNGAAIVAFPSAGGAGAPVDASYVTINAEAGLEGEIQHANIVDEAQKHTPKIHTHDEADITDLDHDALKIKGVTVDDSGIGADKYLKYDGANVAYGSLPAGSTYKLAPSYTIYKVGATYYAMDEDGDTSINGNDCQAVIEAAATALVDGGLILIKAGTYTLDSKVTIPHDNIEIRGETAGLYFPTTTLLNDTDGEFFSVDAVAGVVLRGLAMHGYEQTGNMVYARSCCGGIITDCNFLATSGNAIYGEEIQDWHFIRNQTGVVGRESGTGAAITLRRRAASPRWTGGCHDIRIIQHWQEGSLAVGNRTRTWLDAYDTSSSTQTISNLTISDCKLHGKFTEPAIKIRGVGALIHGVYLGRTLKEDMILDGGWFNVSNCSMGQDSTAGNFPNIRLQGNVTGYDGFMTFSNITMAACYGTAHIIVDNTITNANRLTFSNCVGYSDPAIPLFINNATGAGYAGVLSQISNCKCQQGLYDSYQTVSAANAAWINHYLVGAPSGAGCSLHLTVLENDSNYCAQAPSAQIGANNFQLYLYDLVAAGLEAVAKNIAVEAHYRV